MTDLLEVSHKIQSAKSPESVFGLLSGDLPKALLAVYRQVSAQVHPDKYANDAGQLLIAQTAYIKLGELKRLADRKIEAGMYGDPEALPPEPVAKRDPFVVEVKSKPRKPETSWERLAADEDGFVRKCRFTVNDLMVQGDICDLYHCESSGKQGIFKVAQTSLDNDLLDNESRILRKLYPANQADEKFYRYLPKLQEAFTLKGDKTGRRVNVLPYFEGYVSLATIKKAYPKGLDFRDAVWMFKRALVGLGFVHSQAVVHGAITPEHILVHPIGHGAKIIDWCYAIDDPKARIAAISPIYKDLYAPEILGKRSPTPATDLYMLAKCFLSLLGKSTIPREMREILANCTLEAPEKRPRDAWQLHDELDKVLEATVGKPVYRALVLP